MNEKITYQAPEVELMEINCSGRLLNGSIGTVTVLTVLGWDSEEEDW